MFGLEIFAAVGGMVLIIACVAAFNRHAVESYGHSLFRRGTLLLGALSAWAVAGGIWWSLDHPAYGLGLLFAAAGITSLIGIAVVNVQRTSLATGLVGTAFQFLAFAALAAVGPILALPAMMFALAMRFGAAEPTLRQSHLYHDS